MSLKYFEYLRNLQIQRFLLRSPIETSWRACSRLNTAVLLEKRRGNEGSTSHLEGLTQDKALMDVCMGCFY